MPPFAPAHADETRIAVVHAALDSPQPLSGPRIVAAAAAGQLTDDHGQPLAPATLPLSTVQWWVREERKRRRTLAAVEEPITTTQQRAQDLAARLVTLAGLRVTRLEQQGASADPADVQAAARSVEQVGRAILATAAQPRGSTSTRSDRAATPEPEQDGDAAGDFFAQLAAQGNAPHEHAQPDADARAPAPTDTPPNHAASPTRAQPDASLRVRSRMHAPHVERAPLADHSCVDVGRGTT